jgi:ATP-dependent exoDNAse (exonuclease V) beta subunit
VTRPADWRERETCRDPTGSFIVQAPAGSGKTELLTQRMLSLLSRVEQPEEVVAITFTRKAAAEMSHRLLLQLRAAAEPAGELEPYQRVGRDLAKAVLRHDQQLGWNLLDQPGRLRIRTIDSLCSEIARQLPILSGLGAGQKLTEDAESLYRLAAARTMAVIENGDDELHEDISRVLVRYDNQYDRLIDLLTQMLGHREQWLGHIFDVQREDGFDRDGLERALHILIEAELEAGRKLLPDELLSELPPLLRYALEHGPADEQELRELMAACGGLTCPRLDLPVEANALTHWITLINRLLTVNGKKWRSSVDKNAGFPSPSEARGEEKERRTEQKQRLAALLKRLEHDDRLRDQLNTIRKLPQPGYEEEAWLSLESLLRILLRAAQEWQLVMAETGVADFSEMAHRAIRALGSEQGPSRLALRLDYRIQHLLVDEFQDTSLSQIHLLRRLTAGWSQGDGRTLFLVGDPMQSIYRFRKAEVSLFTKAFEGKLLEHIDLKPVRLKVNFRSELPLVEWVNRVFPEVMPEQTDRLLGAVPYSPAQARPGAGTAGTVSVRLLAARDDRLEASQVIDLVRGLPPEDSCAVLVRSRKHAAEILSLLDGLKEPEQRFRYQALNFNPLATTPLIRDLVSLTLALVQPADRLAWLSVLRAPYAGLDLADLDALAGGQCDSTLLESIADCPRHALSPDGQNRMRRIAPVLVDAARRRGRECLRALVERTWVRLGGPACLENNSELEDAATYFDLLGALENDGLPIDRETLDLRLKNLYAQPDALADGRLQVMTVYAAKGLQFDHVILPGLNRGTGGDSGQLLHWFEMVNDDRIVLSPMRNSVERQNRSGDLIRYISSVEKRRQAHEDGRLLYVAATRAIKSLHLLAGMQTSADDGLNARPGTLMAALWPAIQDEPLFEICEMPDGGNRAEDGEPPVPQLYRRLNTDWTPPPAAPPVHCAARTAEGPVDSIEFRWAGEGARLTGELVHRLLQLIAEQGIERWRGNDGRNTLQAWCLNRLEAAAVTGQAATQILSRVVRAVESCLSSEKGRWLLSAHRDADCEYAVTAVIDGEPRSLVLDRTFVSDGERWIVDYKTSSHAGGDLEGFLRNEAKRYEVQLARYREALALTESRPIRTALYFPLLDRFLEV